MVLLIVTNKTPFHLYGSEVISESKDKRPKVMTKDALIALIFQKIPSIFGTYEPEIMD